MTSNVWRWCAIAIALTALGTPAHAGGSVVVQLEDVRLNDPAIGSGDGFGSALAVDGERVLIGAPNDQASGTARTGAAYVFLRSGTAWSLEARLTAFDAIADDLFGSSVTLDGNTAVVGAQGDNTSSGADVGSLYVFVRSGTTWTFEAKLTASDAAAGDQLGTAVALAGDTLVAGAAFDDDAGGLTGAAYVFTRVGTLWSEAAKLTASDASGSSLFGMFVGYDGTTLVIGAPGTSNATGAAYVFTGAGSSWTERAKLEASDGALGDRFGRVALSGGTIVVGALEASMFAGAAYVFEGAGSAWSETAKLLAPDGAIGDRFGSSTAIDGEVIVVGAQGHDAVDSSAGAAYVYRRTTGAFVFDRKLLATDLSSVNLLGAASAISGGTIACGAPGPFAGSLPGSGYVFSVEAGVPSFCDGSDGALASCPCGNAGASDTGCDLQQGTGGVRLDVVTQQTAPLNRATLHATGFPVSSSPSAIVIRAPGLETAPVVFGDGLRCVSVPLVRLAATFAGGGNSTHTFGHGTMVGAGTFYYQVWFRNQPAMFCTPNAFNVSSGRELVW